MSIKADESAFEMRARLSGGVTHNGAVPPVRNNHETALEMRARLLGEHHGPAAAAPAQQRRRQAQRELPPARKGYQQPLRELPQREPAKPQVAERAPSAIKPDEDAFQMRTRLATESVAKGPIKADESAFEMATRLQGAWSGVAAADVAFTVVDLSVGARRTPTTPTMS